MKAFLVALCLIVTSSLVALGAAEWLARASGYRPRVPASRPEPPIHVPDPVLGWRPVPGRYRFGPYAPGGSPVDVTIRPDGARTTGIEPSGGRPRVALVGCSFTMGWAVSDAETWAWRLQELRPDVEVVNQGVGGYGTLQSLMRMDELLQDPSPRPAHVLYGFIDHSLRNVAAPMWLGMLSLNTRAAATPYCTLTPDGRVERHAPEAWPSFPLHEHSALVALLEKQWLHWRAGNRQAGALTITQQLVSEMAEHCRAAGVGFSMVILAVPERVRATYLAYARHRGIDVIDCNNSNPTPVAGEVHPDGATHRRWGECIAAALAEPGRLPRTTTAAPHSAAAVRPD